MSHPSIIQRVLKNWPLEMWCMFYFESSQTFVARKYDNGRPTIEAIENKNAVTLRTHLRRDRGLHRVARINRHKARVDDYPEILEVWL